MAAAYAFALQMILTGIIATQAAAQASADPSVICFGGTSSSGSTHGGNGTHTSHPTCAICTIASYASLLAEAGHTVTRTHPAAAIFHPAAASFAVADSRHSPRSSQGPPQDA